MFLRVIEVEDRSFDRALYQAMNRPDSFRRFEIHFTDLTGSLIVAFYRKLFPRSFTKSEMRGIQVWFRGKGHELGYANALRPFHPITQQITDCGCATGSIDFRLFGTIYEFTTTIFPFHRRKLPWLGKAKQLMYYIASEDETYGKLKICFEIADKQGRMHRTWVVHLTEEERVYYRSLISKKSYILADALVSGNWRSIPRTNFEWAKNMEVDTIIWLKNHPREVRLAHIKWLIGKSIHLLSRYM